MKESETFVIATKVARESVGEGVERQILGYGPDLMMVRVNFVRGAVGSLHHHPHRQVTYVASGTFDVTVGGRTEQLTQGDCFYVAADIEHGVVAVDNGTLVDVFTPARQDFLRAP